LGADRGEAHCRGSATSSLVDASRSSGCSDTSARACARRASTPQQAEQRAVAEAAAHAAKTQLLGGRDQVGAEPAVALITLTSAACAAAARAPGGRTAMSGIKFGPSGGDQ
jgi:hypothetical protein